jgi:hypothetical protein
MMKEAGVPGLKERGVSPVGAFAVRDKAAEDGDDVLRVVVLPFDSVEDFVNLTERFDEDELRGSAIGEYLDQELSDPAFTRIESSLLKSFTGMPQLEVPGSAVGQDRLFELRVYESHTEAKGKRKVQMFNEGEIELFKQVGLDAVFFGEALVAKNLPNLTYMLVHEDESAMAASWSRFLQHPDWESMKSDPRYKDTVSKVVKRILVPLDYSEIK